MNSKISFIILFFNPSIGRIFVDVSPLNHFHPIPSCSSLAKPPFIPTRQSPTDTSNFIELDHPTSNNVDPSIVGTKFNRQIPFVGFTYSGERILNDYSNEKKMNSSRRSSIHPDEFDRLRQLTERTKSQLLEQTHQIEQLKELHQTNDENHRIYLLRLFHLFPTRSTIDHLPFEQLQNQLEEQIHSLINQHKQLTRKSSREKAKSISNDLSAVLLKYSQIFSEFYEGNSSVGITDENIVNNLTSFLNDLHTNMKKILQDKQTIETKYHSLEKQISRQSLPQKSSVKQISSRFLKGIFSLF